MVQSNDPFREEVILNLSGAGIVPILNLSATIIDFGQVPLSSESFRDLTITNAGDVILSIDSLAIVGQHPDSIIFEVVNLSLPLQVKPDSTYVISIRFKPIKSGMESVQLLIRSNDPSQEEVAVELNGRGLAANIFVGEFVDRFTAEEQPGHKGAYNEVQAHHFSQNREGQGSGQQRTELEFLLFDDMHKAAAQREDKHADQSGYDEEGDHFGNQ